MLILKLLAGYVTNSLNEFDFLSKEITKEWLYISPDFYKNRPDFYELLFGAKVYKNYQTDFSIIALVGWMILVGFIFNFSIFGTFKIKENKLIYPERSRL